MSAFASAMLDGLAAIYGRLGDPAVFTDRDSVRRDCTVIVQHDLGSYGDVANVGSRSVIISVRASELESAPRRRETFTVGCAQYVVDSLISSDSREHRVLAA